MNQIHVDRAGTPTGFVPTRRGLIAASSVAVGATLAMSSAASAATFSVSNLNDSGPNSLRQAVLDANANPGADVVTFASGLSGTIKLTSGDLNVNEALDVQGPGAGVITIDASNNFDGPSDSARIFYASYFSGALSVSGLTLTGGRSDGTFRQPNYDNGGAIYTFAADLVLANAVISGSSTTGSGGGGGVSVNGALSIQSSTISGNSAATSGGGFVVGNGAVTVQGSTISGNQATTNGGGAVMSPSSKAQRIENSTIANNNAGNHGGAIAVKYNGSNPAEGLTVAATTITGNGAGTRGGGIYSGSAPSKPTQLNDTILANNSSTSGPDLFGPVGSAFSLIKSSTDASITETVPGSNIIGADPELGPLAANGGLTQTMALAPTSPAVDKGSAFGLATDQRGVSRPIDFPSIPNSAAPGADGADIGAFELQPSNAFTVGGLKKNKKKGTAEQTVNLPIPDAGSVSLSGKGLKTQTQAVQDNGIVKLKVIAKGKLRKLLKRKGKAKVKETVTYNPTGQSPNSIAKKIKLVKKKRRHH